MTMRDADPWACRLVELAARVLPAGQRQRYAREFVAELYGMTPTQQLRHAAQVLTHAWALRTVLTSNPTSQEETTMTTTTPPPLKCKLGRHAWDIRTNAETGEHYEVCTRCDAYRERTPGTPGSV